MPSRAVVGLTAGLVAVAAGVALVVQWSAPTATPPSAEPPSTTAETTLSAPPATVPPAPPPSLRHIERRPNTPAQKAPTPTPVPTEAPPVSPVAPQTVATSTPSSTPTPSPSPATPAEGRLLVVVTPWADVSIDGVPVGQTPLKALPLPPGTHAVLLTHPAYQPYPRRVAIRSGETFRLVVDLPSDGVRRAP